MLRRGGIDARHTSVDGGESSGAVDVVVFVPSRGAAEPLDELRATSGGARLVGIFAGDEEAVLRKLISGGLDGAVFEADLEETLTSTVVAVCAGQLVIPRRLGLNPRKPALSSREKQILGMVVLGMSNSEIAARLVLAESTIKSHLRSSFRKLGVRSRHEATERILDPAGNLGTGILSISDA